MDNKNKKINKRDVELLFEIGCLRHMQRSWKRFFNPDVANNTEHIFRVVWTSLLISEYENAGDKEKILKMAIVHDITESRTGDVDYLSRQYVERKEDNAIKDILKDTVFEKEFISIWKEYEEKKTIEAKIVKDADNIDVELELSELKAKGHPLGKIWTTQRKKLVYTKLYTKSAKKLWEEIHKSKVSDWHLKGNNRFNAGDWKKKK
ncbi:MAG: HD domain-containing protein [Candidatus Paceibacterota bacterium]|jgi:putative hydrolase of HD superfamily|nr:HD domain-containing protein [Candidatus Paceibacterota bacterium]MDD3072270.1 HD domain-containing protein [Candidatus Paceibacterota bacterium]MDD3729121.1 HD domain-containing protein [Candidatus Paceibacterota bacterium]MDD4201227.1 HD domain-containing protein [Candidatus Paceibacterota bacterium]MDD4467123.1 HD domain-containing protein [Candidatus Paceibacterota bacterium]